MKRPALRFLGVVLLLFITTCTKEDDPTLRNTRWNLVSFEIIGGEASDLGSQGAIIIFSKDGTLRGEAIPREPYLQPGGNSYFSTYELGPDNALSIEVPITGKVGVPPGSKYWEYLEALQNASRYEIEGHRLRIFYEEITKALNFEAE